MNVLDAFPHPYAVAAQHDPWVWTWADYDDDEDDADAVEDSVAHSSSSSSSTTTTTTTTSGDCGSVATPSSEPHHGVSLPTAASDAIDGNDGDGDDSGELRRLGAVQERSISAEAAAAAVREERQYGPKWHAKVRTV